MEKLLGKIMLVISAYPDQLSLTMNEIKGSSEKFERFRNEFTHQMYSNVINDEMQRLE